MGGREGGGTWTGGREDSGSGTAAGASDAAWPASTTARTRREAAAGDASWRDYKLLTVDFNGFYCIFASEEIKQLEKYHFYLCDTPALMPTQIQVSMRT